MPSQPLGQPASLSILIDCLMREGAERQRHGSGLEGSQHGDKGRDKAGGVSKEFQRGNMSQYGQLDRWATLCWFSVPESVQVRGVLMSDLLGGYSNPVRGMASVASVSSQVKELYWMVKREQSQCLTNVPRAYLKAGRCGKLVKREMRRGMGFI